jgi:hypothetical protein
VKLSDDEMSDDGIANVDESITERRSFSSNESSSDEGEWDIGGDTGNEKESEKKNENESEDLVSILKYFYVFVNDGRQISDKLDCLPIPCLISLALEDVSHLDQAQGFIRLLGLLGSERCSLFAGNVSGEEKSYIKLALIVARIFVTDDGENKLECLSLGKKFGLV